MKIDAKDIVEELDSQIDFWLDEAAASKDDYPYLALCHNEAERIGIRKQAFERVVGLFHQHGIGLELAHKDHPSWAVILPDASSVGKYRYQAFSKDGFYAHVSRDTVVEILLEAVSDGFTEPDNGALERLAGTSQWRKGLRVTDLLTAVNAGRMTHEQAEKEYEALEKAL